LPCPPCDLFRGSFGIQFTTAGASSRPFFPEIRQE
jgi:hypothetical protein